MSVSNKINYLLEEMNLSKKDFAKKLLSLEPRLDSTGKPPSLSTIYGYLNGGREIKIELIPYISEVLQINEQELFSNDIEYSSEYNIRYSKEVREILNLLQFAPKVAIENIKNYLVKFKDISNERIKDI